MQYAIELFFNEEMEKKLFHYAQRIAEEMLPAFSFIIAIHSALHNTGKRMTPSTFLS